MARLKEIYPSQNECLDNYYQQWKDQRKYFKPKCLATTKNGNIRGNNSKPKKYLAIAKNNKIERLVQII